MRCEPCQPEVQQKSAVCLLLEGPPGWERGSLTCLSLRPHGHPDRHTEAKLELIRDMRQRSPDLGMSELWYRLRQRGHTRRP